MLSYHGGFSFTVIAPDKFIDPLFAEYLPRMVGKKFYNIKLLFCKGNFLVIKV